MALPYCGPVAWRRITGAAITGVSPHVCVIQVSWGVGELRVVRVNTLVVVRSGNLLVGFLCVAISQNGQVSS